MLVSVDAVFPPDGNLFTFFSHVDKLLPYIFFFEKISQIVLLCLHAKSRFFFFFSFSRCLCLTQKFTGSIASGTASLTNRAARAETSAREFNYAEKSRAP